MATGLAAELKESVNIDLQLVKGAKGIFDVAVDGKIIFSKYDKNRFPHFGEITEILNGEPFCMKND